MLRTAECPAYCVMYLPDHLPPPNPLTYRICRPDCLQTPDYEHGPQLVSMVMRFEVTMVALAAA